MLTGNLSESERSVKLAQARPTLVARLRLFGMLAILGPLFAGLNSLVLESVPQVEVRFIPAESTQPTPDVVVVERVVDRLVYVPVDNLSVAAPDHQAEDDQESSGVATREAGIGETTDDTASDAVADQPETELPPAVTAAVSVAVRPVVYARPVATDEPVVDEVAEAEPEDASAEADAVVEVVPTDEPVAAAAPRQIIVHTMVWDGEQFVQSADTIVETPAMPDVAGEAEVNDGEAGELVADDAELAEIAEPDDELVKIAEAEVADAAGDEVATDEDTEQVAAAEEGDRPEQAVAGDDELESATADEAGDEPALAVSGDGPGELEQIASAIGAVEDAVAAGASEQVEQVVEGATESEDVADSGDKPEQVSDEPGKDDPTRARVQAADAESTPAPTN